MSLDNRIQRQNSEIPEQYANVEWHKSETGSPEDACSVITTNAKTVNDEMPTYFDMPLLDGIQLHGEFFTASDVTYDKSNNNNEYVPFHLNIGSAATDILVVEPLETQNACDSNIGSAATDPQQSIDFRTEIFNGENINLNRFISNESSFNYTNELTNELVNFNNEDISEFLVFHKTSSEFLTPSECNYLQQDPKLQLGCFVKLKKNEVSSALIERQVAPEKVLRLTNRQRTCTVDTTLPKKLKRKQSKSKESSGDLVEHSASPPKRSKTKKSKTLCVDTPNSNSERPSIRLKLVRQNSTIYNCILLPDVSIQPLDVPKCQIKTRSCSVVIEPLPIKNTCQPKSTKKESSKAESSHKESSKSKAESSKPKSSKAKSSKAKPSQAESSKTESSKTESSTTESSKAKSPTTESSKAECFKAKSSKSSKSVNLETTSAIPASEQENNTNTNHLTSTSNVCENCYTDELPLDLSVPKNKNSALNMAMTTKQNPVDNIVLKELTTISNETQPCQVPFSIDNAACIDKPTTTDDRLDFNNSPKSNDDNFSISDGISLFGSDCDLDSPKRDMIESEKPVINQNSEMKAKTYRIPKKKKTSEKTKEIEQSTTEFDGLGTNDELNVTHFMGTLAQMGYLGNMPRMLSPIKDIDFYNKADSKINSNNHKKKVQIPQMIRPAANKKTMDNDIKNNTQDSKNRKPKNRSNTIDGTINNKRSISTGLDASHIHKEKKRKFRSNSIDGTTENKTSDYTDKILKSDRQLNAGVDADAVSSEISKRTKSNICQPLELCTGIQSITNTKKYPNIVIKVSCDNSARNITSDVESDASTKISSQQQPVQVLSNQPQTSPHQLPRSSRQAMRSKIQKATEILRPNLRQLEAIKHLRESFTLEGRKTHQKYYRSQVLTMFNQPCINYLSKKPCETPCSFSHELPHGKMIYEALQTFSNDLVLFIYSDFLVKNNSTFEQYFPLLCQFFGNRKLKATLTTLVKDCEKYEKYEFFQVIFDGLLLCGMKKVDALSIIVNCCNSICSASDEAFLKIIEPDPQSFIQILSKLPRLLTPQLVSTLMLQLSSNSNNSQLRECVDLLERIGENIVSIDKTVLTGFCIPIFKINDDNLSAKVINILANVMNK